MCFKQNLAVSFVAGPGIENNSANSFSDFASEYVTKVGQDIRLTGRISFIYVLDCLVIHRQRKRHQVNVSLGLRKPIVAFSSAKIFAALVF